MKKKDLKIAPGEEQIKEANRLELEKEVLIKEIHHSKNQFKKLTSHTKSPESSFLSKKIRELTLKLLYVQERLLYLQGGNEPHFDELVSIPKKYFFFRGLGDYF